MPEDQPATTTGTSERDRAVAHGDGPLLILGAPGTGKTELLARRLAHLVAAGARPESVLMIASRQATAGRLRERCEALLEGSFEELWVGSWDAIGERLLHDYPEEAGLDPFFDVLSRGERLAMLLDRLDRLPLRRHEIRGNPAGLLARLLARIDGLKAERVGATTLSERALALPDGRRAGGGDGSTAGGPRVARRREPEPALRGGAE